MKVTSYCYVMRTKVYKEFKFVRETLHSADTEDAILYLLRCTIVPVINAFSPLRLNRVLHEGERNRYVILGGVFNSIDDPRYHYIITIEKIPKWS